MFVLNYPQRLPETCAVFSLFAAEGERKDSSTWELNAYLCSALETLVYDAALMLAE